MTPTARDLVGNGERARYLMIHATHARPTRRKTRGASNSRRYQREAAIAHRVASAGPPPVASFEDFSPTRMADVSVDDCRGGRMIF